MPLTGIALVTGGAGFIGSHLVDALVELGHRVRILDSLVGQVHEGKVPEHLNTSAEFIKADVCEADAVAKALDGIDVVYHIAAVYRQVGRPCPRLHVDGPAARRRESHVQSRVPQGRRHVAR